MVQVALTGAFGNGLFWGACLTSIMAFIYVPGVRPGVALALIIGAVVGGFTINVVFFQGLKIGIPLAVLPWTVGFAAAGGVLGNLYLSLSDATRKQDKFWRAIVISWLPMIAIWGCSAQVIGAGAAQEDAEAHKQAQRQVAAVDPHTPDGHKTDVAEGQAFLDQLSQVASPCDLAFRYTNAALASNGMQTLYHNAEVGSSRCQEAADKVSNIEIPPHATDAAQAAIKDAQNDLFQVLSTQRGLMDRLKTFANEGGAKPSDIESYQSDFSEMVATKTSAVGRIVDALQGEGAFASVSHPKRHHRKVG